MFVGVVIAFILFGLRTRKIGAELGAGTFAQFLGKYYKSRAVQVFVGAIIFITMPLYAAVVMKGGAVFMEEVFHIDYNMALLIFTLVIAAYVVAGGIKGVMYTDALQAVIMFICMLVLLFSIYRILGMNFTEANQALTDLAPQVPEKFKALGHQGWTAMPVTGSPQWYTLVTSLILGVGIGCLAQPQLVVRFMTVKSGRELKRGVFIGCLFIFITVGTIYHTGALSNLYFMKTSGKVATDLIQDIDKIIPYFIDNAMMKQDPRVLNITTFYGSSSPRFQTAYAPQIGGTNFAQFIVNTKSDKETVALLDKYTPMYTNYFSNAMASNVIPVVLVKASLALCKVCSGALSNGFPSLSKKEQSIVSVGSSANGSTKAVR